MQKEKVKTKPVIEPGDLLPEWYKEGIVTPFRARIASEFIVHGDVNSLFQDPDNYESYITLRQFWEKMFSERDIVIFYNIASGVQFLSPDMEREFKKISGIGGDDSSAGSGDPVAAAKAGLAQKRGIPREPESCLPLIEKVLREREGVAVVINSAHFIAPNVSTGLALPPNERTNIERLKNWGQSWQVRRNNNIIILLTDQSAKIHQELKQSGSGIQTVFIPKPDKEERLKYIGLAIKYYSEQKGLKAEELATATNGMSLRQLQEIFLQSEQAGRKVDLEYVKAKKKEILNNEYGDVMEVVEPEFGLDYIGGLEHVKGYFKDILQAIKDGETRLVPMGTTLMGPPGTGKTAIVEALAFEAKYSFVKRKNLRSMWLGQSEERSEKSINGLRALAPVFVMNDEADLTDADRDSYKGDSGVSERLMRDWMQFISDPKIQGKVILINCTNRPDRMDPALKRSGRSDDRILIPMPSENEIIGIFKVALKKYKIPSEITDFGKFAKMTKGRSGADIIKITQNAFAFANKGKKKKVDDEAMKAAIEDFIPSASQAEIDRMTLMAISESSSRRLLPPDIREIMAEIESRDLVENGAEIIKQIKDRKII